MNWFKVLEHRDNKSPIYFVGIKILEMAFQLEAEVWHGKVSLEKVPKMVVQEVDIKEPLHLYRELRQNPVTVEVDSYVLIIAPLVVKVLDNLLALMLINLLLSVIMA